MTKQQNVSQEGEVVQELGNSMFKVQLPNGFEVLCTISGKIRKFYVRIMVGDKVKIEMSPYDLTRGRIVYRFPPKQQSINNNK